MSPDHRSSRELNGSDLELIAELVDGALNDEGRRAALRLIHESSAAYEVYVDAVATLRGTGHDVVGSALGDEAPGPAPAVGSRAEGRLVATLRSTPRWRALVPVAAAAGVALALVLRPDAPLVPDLANELGPAALTVALGPASGAAAYDHPLGAVRGGTTPGSELGRAFQLGVRVMDAEAEIVATREEAARASHRAALDLLGSLEAPATVLAPYRGYVDGLDGERRSRVDEEIEAWLSDRGEGLAHYRFGKTAEALRFAIVAGEAALIRPIARRVAETLPDDLPAAAQESLDALFLLIDGDDAPDAARERMSALLSGVMSTAAR